MLKETKTLAVLFIGMIALFFFASNATYAQGMGGMYGGMGMGGGMGMYGGMGGMGMGMGASQGTGMVQVKYGEKVYDAVFGDLIDYKVYNITVPADAIGVHYYDDGTHGDEISYDGMPSLITTNTDGYLGPFSITYKRQLRKALEHAEKMGALKFYNLNIATEMKDSKVTNLQEWQSQLDDILEGLRVRIARFEGYDDEKYIKTIDPQMFESLEGFGAMSQVTMGPGGYLPDLPPPPGIQRAPQEGMEGTMEGIEQPGEGQETGRFNPIGRATNAADALGGGQLQATEAMNQLP